MAKIVDLTGRRFGKLVVLKMNARKVMPNGKIGEIEYLCLCDCGTECIVPGRILRTKRRKTCGLCKVTMAEGKLLKMEPAFEEGYKFCAFPTESCKFSRKGHCCHSCSWYRDCEERCNNSPERCGA